jgi:hypothetical protein
LVVHPNGKPCSGSGPASRVLFVSVTVALALRLDRLSCGRIVHPTLMFDSGRFNDIHFVLIPAACEIAHERLN